MAFLIMLFLTLASPIWIQAQDARAVSSIDSTLNRLHDAAAEADGRRYFPLFTDDGVFIGTDAGERWTLKQFRAYAEPFFSKGQGWIYKPRSRHIVIADVPCKCVAWFDELLDSQNYGTSRGTGVLVRKNGSWKIAQYALTFPIPNDLAKGMTAEIRSFEAKQKK
ncbi:MAG: nuclear transport factor 2 family protein [Gemmatimonadaceae bacterium]